MRVFDLVDNDLRAKVKSVPNTHWPSSASAWLDCERCGGSGMEPISPDAVNTAPIECQADSCDDGRVLHGSCMRALYWSWLGTPPSNPTEPAGRLKMDMGNAGEDIIMGLVQKHMPMMRQVEAWLRPDGLKHPIHGYIDGVGIDPLTGGLVVVECKTTYGYGAKSVQKNGPKVDWWIQTCLYVKALREIFPKNEVAQVKFLVLARDSAYRTEIDRVPDEDTVDLVVERCVERWAELERWLDETVGGADAIPRAEYKPLGKKGDWSHWRCSYCAYKDMCKERDDA